MSQPIVLWLVLAAWVIAAHVARRLLLGAPLRPTTRPAAIEQPRPAWADDFAEQWCREHSGPTRVARTRVLPPGVRTVRTDGQGGYFVPPIWLDGPPAPPPTAPARIGRPGF